MTWLQWILPAPIDITLTALLFPQKVDTGTNPAYYASQGGTVKEPPGWILPIAAATAVGAYFVLKGGK